jgi:hypothetical protein
MSVVVSIVWYKVFPAVFGGQKGIAEFNLHLSRHHTLFCLCSADNETTSQPYPVLPLLKGGRLGFLTPSNWTCISRTIRQTGATHLLVEHAYFGLAALFARYMTRVRVVVHAHNIESKVFRDSGRWWWPAVRLLERHVYRRSDLVLFKTVSDRDFAVERWGVDMARTHVVPFGITRRANPTAYEKREASKRVRDRYGIPDDCRIILFCGTLDYEPNARALRWMVDELLPELRRQGLDRFRLIVTGRLRKPSFAWVAGLKDADYRYLGEVEHISDLMTGADLFVNPVDSGGGIKVKNLEALSHGLTVVTTSHSATGIDRMLTGDKLVVSDRDDLPAFATAVASNLASLEATPEAFFEHAHWERIAADAAARIEACRVSPKA